MILKQCVAILCCSYTVCTHSYLSLHQTLIAVQVMHAQCITCPTATDTCIIHMAMISCLVNDRDLQAAWANVCTYTKAEDI